MSSMTVLPLSCSLYKNNFIWSRVIVIHHFRFNTGSYNTGRKLLTYVGKNIKCTVILSMHCMIPVTNCHLTVKIPCTGWIMVLTVCTYSDCQYNRMYTLRTFLAIKSTWHDHLITQTTFWACVEVNTCTGYTTMKLIVILIWKFAVILNIANPLVVVSSCAWN